MLEWKKANDDVAEAERRLKMTNPEDKAATQAAQAALVAARDKVRTMLPPGKEGPAPEDELSFDTGDDPPVRLKVTEGAGPRVKVGDVGTAVREQRARMSKARVLERQAEARRLHIEEAKGTKPSRRSRRADEKGIEDYAELRKLKEQTKPGEHGAAQETMLKHLMQSPGSQVADEEVPSKTTLLKAADKKRKRKGKKPIMTDWPM